MAKDLSVAVLMDFYGDILTPKQRDVMEMYYDQDLSLGEIAENTGITRQGVLDSIHRGEIQMQEMEKKLHLYARYQETSAAIKQVEEAAREIINLNLAGYSYSAAIEKQAELVLEGIKLIAEKG